MWRADRRWARACEGGKKLPRSKESRSTNRSHVHYHEAAESGDNPELRLDELSDVLGGARLLVHELRPGGACGGSATALIASIILTKYSGLMKVTTHLYHISHCKIILVIVWYKLVDKMDPPSILSEESPRLDPRKELGRRGLAKCVALIKKRACDTPITP